MIQSTKFGGSLSLKVILKDEELPYLSTTATRRKNSTAFALMGQCFNKFCSAGEDSEEDETIHLGGGNVQLVSNYETWEEKLSEAKNSGMPVVANFSAPWCAPCKAMVPTYREIADNHRNIMFLTVDVDELADLSTSWDVKATPTFHILRNGEPVDKLVGANREELLKKVAALAESSTTQK